MATDGWSSFLKYALAHQVPNGPSTIEALEKVYRKHKGSRHATIVALFKTQGQLDFMRQYDREVGLGR